MRFLALFVGLMLPLLATCQVGDDDLVIITLDECGTLITESEAYTREAFNRAADGHFDQAWRIIDEGFILAVRSTNVCTEDRLEGAEIQVRQNRAVNRAMICTFHIENVKDAATRTQLAYNEIRDYEQSLFHAQFLLYSIEEGLKWCISEDDKKILASDRTKVLEAIVQIEKSIATAK